MDPNPTRRRYLRVAGTCGVVGLAGCVLITSQDEPDGPLTNPTPTETHTTGNPDTPAPRALDAPDPVVEEPIEEPIEPLEDPHAPDPGNDQAEPAGPAYDTSWVTPPPGHLAGVPVPANPWLYEYPTAGSGDAPVTVRFYGGYKCRFTRKFVQTFLPDLIDRFVEPGHVDIEFHAVAFRPDGRPYHGDDGVRAARAGLGVWYHDPDSYWNYFEHVFENMERHHGWATTDTLLALMAAAGVEDLERIEGAIESGAYVGQLDTTMGFVQDLGFHTIPRLAVAGQHVSPNVAPAATIALFERHLDTD